MSLHDYIFYVEIPVPVSLEYTPEEKPDYSERSPCPGSPAEVDPVDVFMAGLPQTKEAWVKIIEAQNPNWKAEAIAKIEEDEKRAAGERAAMLELQDKYEGAKWL